MDKRLRMFIILFGALCVLFLGFLFFSAKNTFKKNLSYNFNGVVEAVSYDVKGIPKVIISGEEYYLSAGYNFNYQIEKGDS